MILKDLETADKVLKKEPDETPPSSVDASPLQVSYLVYEREKKQLFQVHIPQHNQPRIPTGPSPYNSPLQGWFQTMRQF